MAHIHNDHANTKLNFNKAFAVGIFLNSIFIIVEIIFGLKSNSLALLADAGHNAGDVIGLLLAWGATILAKKKSSKNFTYGLQSSTIVAALANSVLLLVAVGAISLEAIKRLENVEGDINSEIVILVAALGILINGITAWFFFKASKKDLNIRGAFLHMVADALVSLGVVISAIIIMKTGWTFVDPLISLIIAFVIIASTWRLFVDSLKLSLHGVPQNIDYLEVKNYLLNLDEVKEIHDLHIWAMSTSDVSLSTHLLLKKNPEKNFLRKVEKELDHKFGINHTTIQIEVSGEEDCNLRKSHN